MSRALNLLVAGLRHLVRPRLQRVKGPEEARASFERTARLVFQTPPYLCHIADRAGLDRIRCGPCTPGKIILYFHGGGYIAGSPKSHAAMLGRLSRLSGLEVCAPDYPLAPEHPAPAAFDAAVAAWAHLIASGYAPSDVVIGGDSAGGGLALALLSHLCRAGTPPAALFAMSPWCDLTLSGESLTRNADRDPFLPVARIRELVDYVVPAGMQPADPRVSPLFAAFPDCPPVLLQHGETEILFDDCRRMAEHLRGSGAEVSEYLHPTAPHVWHLFDGWIPEARRSLCDIAYFARMNL